MKNTLKIITGCLLILMFVSAGSVWAGNVSVTVTLEHITSGTVTAPAGQSGDPEEVLSYDFVVENTGNGSDTFDLRVRSSHRWLATLLSGNTTGILASGEAKPVNVELTIPSNTGADTVDTLTLTAVSKADKKVKESNSVTTTVNQAAGVAASIGRDAKRGRPGETVTYSFRVNNTGNGTDGFTLTAESASPWPVTITGGDHIESLGSGRVRTVYVQVSIPPTAVNGDTDIVTFTAVSDFNPLISSSAQATTTVRARRRR